MDRGKEGASTILTSSGAQARWSSGASAGSGRGRNDDIGRGGNGHGRGCGGAQARHDTAELVLVRRDEAHARARQSERASGVVVE
jgi:hypothetical protein